MRQLTLFLILLALFVVLVGSRFRPSDGDKLSAVTRIAAAKIRAAMPPAARIAAPVNALRNELPVAVEDRVKGRLDADKSLTGVSFAVSSDGGAVTLRGVVANAALRRRAVELAESTVGVERVVDELAVPVD
jgi:hypothetical protein